MLIKKCCDDCLHHAGLAKAGVDPANAGTSVQVCLNETTAHLQMCEVSQLSNVNAGSHGHFRCCHHMLHLQFDVESSESNIIARMSGINMCGSSG